MWSWKFELVDTPQRFDCCLQLQIFWTKYCDMQRFNIQFTMPPALKEACAKILIRVISRLMALRRASSCLGRALFQVSFPPQFERFPLFLFLNFSFTFLPILNSTTSPIASFAPNLHFADTSSASPRLYESFSDVGESRVWFASKNLTPCRMHWNAFLIVQIIAKCHRFPNM